MKGHQGGKIPNYLLQRKMFSYLTMIDDFDEQIERYWDKYEKRISAWYLAQKRPDDLIISASPSCIIGPIARRLVKNKASTVVDWPDLDSDTRKNTPASSLAWVCSFLDKIAAKQRCILI